VIVEQINTHKRKDTKRQKSEKDTATKKQLPKKKKKKKRKKKNRAIYWKKLRLEIRIDQTKIIIKNRIKIIIEN
jgi:hypothetical protein